MAEAEKEGISEGGRAAADARRSSDGKGAKGDIDTIDSSSRRSEGEDAKSISQVLYTRRSSNLVWSPDAEDGIPDDDDDNVGNDPEGESEFFEDYREESRSGSLCGHLARVAQSHISSKDTPLYRPGVPRWYTSVSASGEYASVIKEDAATVIYSPNRWGSASSSGDSKEQPCEYLCAIPGSARPRVEAQPPCAWSQRGALLAVACTDACVRVYLASASGVQLLYAVDDGTLGAAGPMRAIAAVAFREAHGGDPEVVILDAEGVVRRVHAPTMASAAFGRVAVFPRAPKGGGGDSTLCAPPHMFLRMATPLSGGTCLSVASNMMVVAGRAAAPSHERTVAGKIWDAIIYRLSDEGPYYSIVQVIPVSPLAIERLPAQSFASAARVRVEETIRHAAGLLAPSDVHRPLRVTVSPEGHYVALRAANGALAVYASDGSLVSFLGSSIAEFAWWSSDALALCESGGKLRVVRVDALNKNILFGPSLEYGCPVTFAPLAMGSKTTRKRGIVALECTNFAWVPHASASQASIRFRDKALLREYEIESVLEATPSDVYHQKIVAAEYGIALRIAEKYALNPDDVYKAQWRRRAKYQRKRYRTIWEM